MRVESLLFAAAYANNSDYDPEFDPNEVGAAPLISQNFLRTLNAHSDLTFAEFEKLYPQLRVDNNWFGK